MATCHRRNLTLNYLVSYLNQPSHCFSSNFSRTSPGSSGSSPSSDLHQDTNPMHLTLGPSPLSAPTASSMAQAYHHHHHFGHGPGNAMASLHNPFGPGNTFGLTHQSVHHPAADPHHDFLLRTAVTHWWGQWSVDSDLQEEEDGHQWPQTLLKYD